MSAEEGPRDPRDRELLESLARKVVERRMEVPALLTLESVKPLSLLGSQALHFFEPLVTSLFPWPGYRRFAELVEDRASLEWLAQRIEALAREARSARHPGS
jgi:hypothetical protein